MDPGKLKFEFIGRNNDANILIWRAKICPTPLGTYGHVMVQIDALYFYGQMWGKTV